MNGNPVSIPSETTYHYITESQAKIKKVRSNGEGLAGATLQIYENNSTNCDANGNLLMTEGDNPVPVGTPKTIILNDQEVTSFTSTTDVITFYLLPGDYILHESAAPDTYKKADDIKFTIDIEGITHVGNSTVDYVEMVDEPLYKIIFHENKPGGTFEECNKAFKILEPMDLTDGKITHFYDIPEWAGDEYVFAGWYYGSKTKPYNDYNSAANIKNYATIPAGFGSDTFTIANSNSSDKNYHIYAKWIEVGTVAQDKTDTNTMTEDYRGFGLSGVQIRNPEMLDHNFNDDEKPGGLRFVTSFSQTLYDQINALSEINVDGVPVEYGYVVGTEANIETFISHYNVKNPAKYKLQYKGDNVNGVDTTGEERSAETDYRYITNVNCTSRHGTDNGVVADDHKNFDAYRLFTLVVTYDDDDSKNRTGDKIDARAYIRYYDANGKLRVFYNDYRKNMYYGGCMCSFDQVAEMAS